ncbi:TonB-dependent receptor [Pseudoxanthomonas broegbernensis]|uniref:TonB-dependent receptor n=1 Tax=Pseudoxanthomonas broegbernensis TaxID=83619 RepID=A0A7V8K7E2_9GAMM|nr:TonB-dependent receptor [Pseudoxanthomonas broegbernensis]KAF1686812.1 TonB-dependent receptor [Pseudoxanthomonas broegbernensis]MBB6065606.1 TonB-dependent receptor [Pseudoxanthomonas broegbernensis]
MQNRSNRRKTPVTLLAASIGLALYVPSAFAQEAPDAGDTTNLDTIVVTGYRASLERAIDIKRGEAGVVDAIVAEDIADFPDLNLAESLQRIPGVSITRDGGEGRNISVRGLGPQFTRVRINGIEALATGGGTDTAGGVNRGRGFDFNTFASELFSQLLVRKTSSADVEEGSLGATVDLRTGRPFDYDGFTLVVGGQASYSDLAGKVAPRATALVSNTWADGRVGALLSVAYTDRTVHEEGSDSVRWKTATGDGGFSPSSPFAAANDASVFHPRIPRYNLFRHEQERLGVTGSLQFKASDRTEIVLDTLYARFDANRWQDNINAVSFSRSGNGKPDTVVLDGEIDSTGNLVYGVFDNVDIRSEGRYDEQTTEFKQWGLSLAHEFSDSFSLDALIGGAVSTYDNPIQTTVIADKFDVDGYSWDYRGNRRLPVFNYGSIDPTDPNGWTLAEIRLRPQWVENTFDTASLDLSWIASSYFTLKGGVNAKEYEYKSREWGRGTAPGNRVETVPGSFMDSATLAALMRRYSVGHGGSAVVPDVQAFARELGIHDGTGLFALSNTLNNLAANNRNVTEKVTGFYLQGDFNFDIGSVPVRGNLGVRRVDSELTSDGWSIVGGLPQATRVVHEYKDTLPSLNIAAELTPDLVLRFAAAEVMARPDLGFLNPGATVSVAGGARTVSTGNPKLDPFRAKTLDLGLEWYFGDGGLLSAGLFYKDIESYVQTSRETRAYSTSGLPESLIAGTGATMSDEFVFTQPLNTPGGDLKGYELSYQQPFSFLPGLWKDFGVQLNYTHVESEIQYLSSTGAPSAKGPMVGLSENAWNATLYYDNGDFSARVSAAYRDEYMNTIPGRENTDMEGTAATTTVDASLSYNISKNLSVSIEGLNLTDEWNDMWIDSTRDLPIAYTHTGRQYMLGLRYKF